MEVGMVEVSDNENFEVTTRIGKPRLAKDRRC